MVSSTGPVTVAAEASAAGATACAGAGFTVLAGGAGCWREHAANGSSRSTGRQRWRRVMSSSSHSGTLGELARRSKGAFQGPAEITLGSDGDRAERQPIRQRSQLTRERLRDGSRFAPLFHIG